MPTYLYECGSSRKRFDRIARISEHQSIVECRCGAMASQIITPPRVIIPAHMSATGQSSYQSPIDGRLITTAAQRREDMARNDCVEYDPGMRQDVDRKVAADELALDRALDETFDREIAAMPAHKLERLDAEMCVGMNAEVARI
jgi:hypothetical protein